jgi:hypothetical protein
MMDANTGLKPSFVKRDGVRLAYFEAGPAHGTNPLSREGWLCGQCVFGGGGERMNKKA